MLIARGTSKARGISKALLSSRDVAIDIRGVTVVRFLPIYLEAFS